METWATLFDRAAAHGATVEDVEAALAERRERGADANDDAAR